MAQEVAIYWLLAQLFGLIGLPLAGLLLGGLPDRGYAFAKPLGLLVAGYLAWLLAMFGLAPFGGPTVVAAGLGVAGMGLWLAGGPRAAALGWRRALAVRWPAILLSETIFLAATLFVVWMRVHDPTPWGTERPMDFAFFNAMQRSGSFPPGDPWLAGFSINYYYFGYLLMAVVALLSGIDSGAAYNLSLALIFGLTAQGVAGLVANLILLATEGRRESGAARTAEDLQASTGLHPSPFSSSPRPDSAPWLFPLLGVIFVLVAANQSGSLQVALGDERAVALDGGQLVSALGQAAGGANTIALREPVVTGDFGSFSYWERQDKVAGFNWWWPSRSLWDEYPVNDPSRPEVTVERRYTITEFPLFSFRLGDMHPHVMALPFGLLATAIALGVLVRPTPPAFGVGREGWAELLLTGVIIGSLYAINSWDLPTYVLLYGAALAICVLREGGQRRPWLELARLLAMVVAVAYLLFLPFHLTFRSLVGAAEPWIDLPLIGRLSSIIGPYLASRSGLHAFLIIFGLFALPIIALVYVARTKDERATPDAAQKLGVISKPESLLLEPWSLLRMLPWLPPLLLVLGLLIGFPLLALGGLGVLALLRAWRLRDHPGEAFGMLLAALGCAVLFGTELVYIRDVFEGSSARMNTIFKFYYQIWLLWGALAPFALWWILRRSAGWRRGVGVGVAGLTFALLVGALVYPWLALGELGRGERQGLQGSTPRQWTPAGAASITWLRREAPPGSVVLEAAPVGNVSAVGTEGDTPQCGGSYDSAWPEFPNNGSYGFGGVSSATGLPTVLGWHGHQIQWRGGDSAALDQLATRCADVDAIFRSVDPGRARELLGKYGVDFVYVGGLEQRLYPPESLAKFADLGAPVFQQDEVTIYRIEP
jgi:YYY domain-containing protein